MAIGTESKALYRLQTRRVTSWLIIYGPIELMSPPAQAPTSIPPNDPAGDVGKAARGVECMTSFLLGVEARPSKRHQDAPCAWNRDDLGLHSPLCPVQEYLQGG